MNPHCDEAFRYQKMTISLEFGPVAATAHRPRKGRGCVSAPIRDYIVEVLNRTKATGRILKIL